MRLVLLVTVVGCLAGRSRGFTFFQDDRLYEGSECKLEGDGGPGLCRKITECPSRLEEILEGRRGADSAGRCGFAGNIEVVCCPTAIPAKSSPRTADIACEHYQNTVVVNEEVGFHIFGGRMVEDHEFPYVAALGYKDGDRIQYDCGGTLISVLHVLTAAHCVHNRLKRVPVEVQLGALDIAASGNGAQRIPVKEVMRHGEHRLQRLYYDIAVLRLARRAELSAHVRPICLPSETDRRLLETADADLVVVGWGSTNFDGPKSKDLMKTPALRLAERDACAQSYTNVAGLQQGLADYMLCVVDRNTSRGADSCPGDSGGPLLMEHDGVWTVVGVTAFGVGCGGTVPGIYTAIYPFLDWIEDVVWRRVVLELINPRIDVAGQPATAANFTSTTANLVSTSANFGSTPANFGSTSANFGSTSANYGSTSANFGSTSANRGSTPANFGSTSANRGSTSANFGSTSANLGSTAAKANFTSTAANFASTTARATSPVTAPTARRRATHARVELNGRDLEERIWA